MDNTKLMIFSQNHLAYEIYSLYGALDLFAKQNPQNLLTIGARNLFLEGVITHSRSLYEFLYFSTQKKADDALAIHYFETPEAWELIRPKIPEHFKDFYKRASKEIMHLTYTRLERTEITKRWDLLTITKDLLATLLLFAEKADPEKLHRDFINDLKVCKLMAEKLYSAQEFYFGKPKT